MSTNRLDSERTQIAVEIAQQYGLDPARILFLNPRKPTEPWLPPELLLTVARKTVNFRSIEHRYSDFIPELEQIIYTATVIDEQGRSFTSPGVATLREKTPGGESINEHALAGGRALSAALNAAGYNPLKPGSEKPFKSAIALVNNDRAVTEAGQRHKDLGRIHILGEQAGLITGTVGLGTLNNLRYREWLKENFQVGSAGELDAVGRASVINALEQLVKQQAV